MRPAPTVHSVSLRSGPEPEVARGSTAAPTLSDGTQNARWFAVSSRSAADQPAGTAKTVMKPSAVATIAMPTRRTVDLLTLIATRHCSM